MHILVPKRAFSKSANKGEFKHVRRKRANDHPILHFAADELKKYLRMMLPEGGDIPIGRGEGGFRIGLLSEQSDDDTVVIDTSETGGEILGSNPEQCWIAVSLSAVRLPLVIPGRGRRVDSRAGRAAAGCVSPHGGSSLSRAVQRGRGKPARHAGNH